VVRKRPQKETEAARRKEEGRISGPEIELQALRTDPRMTLLTAVEYITLDPARRLSLYRRCSPEDPKIRFCGMRQDDPRLLKIASSVAKDLTLLERRAKAEGFHV
jgi:hypothetical protein